MPINLRVIPEWTDFAPRLVKAIQQREQQSDGFNQTDKEETLLTNVRPNIQFHYSCAPLHHFHCITSYSGCGANVVLGFKWGQTELDHQIVTWVNDGQGNLRLHSTVPVYGRYKIELMLFIPSRGMLVGYCNDMWLRILTDKTQEMVVLFQSKCPFLVASMHYCPETSILLTGSMGLIALWDLNPFTQSPLSLLRTLDWTNSSLRRDAVISAFVPQCQTNSFYALCHRQVKSFENTGVKEQFEFRGQSVATLRCAVTEWRQRYLYTGDAEGYMQVWSYDTRRLFLQFRAHADAVTSLVLLSESGTVLSSSTGCWIKQWTRSGDLLLKLHTDMTGGVRSMWKLGKNVVLCQSSNSLDVWHLNSVYRSFNDTACSVRVLQRLDCGVGGKARVLAVTQEGIMRFFSPVSGELLFLSWPFLHIDKALGFAYDPVREELFICDGSVDVLVLNTTLNPCPVKHIINTVKDGYDGVMCLASVLLRRLQDQAGCGSPLCLVFSGHCNGKLQLLAPLGLTCRPKQAHIGAICQMTSRDAGETPLICCFGTDNEFTLWSVSFGEHHVNLIPQYRITCNFTPVHCKVLKGFICAISPEQNLVLYSLNGEKKPTVVERKKSERISCLDYCPQLDTIAVSGDSGKVEIWNPCGDLVAEIQLGVPVTQVCFGNTRGDILASFSDSINIMSVTHILPPSYLRSVLRQAPADEIIEVPIPFVPKSPSHYDISLVAKMYLKHDEKENVATETHADSSTRDNVAEDSTIPTEVPKHVARKSVVRPFTFKSQTQPAQSSPAAVSEDEPGELDGLEVSGEALTRAETLQDTFLSFFRPIASGGYIPNSVVKDIHNMEQLAKEKGRLEITEKEKKEKMKPLLRYYNRITTTCPSEHTEHSKTNEDILVHSKRARMQDSQQQMDADDPVKLMELFFTMLEDLDTASEEEYKKIILKLYWLLTIMEEHGYAKDVVEALRQKLLAHVNDSSVQWRQLESLRGLRTLCSLQREDISMVAKLLVNPSGDLRSFAHLISNAEFNVFDKQGLRKKLRQFTSQKEVEALLAQLSNDLHLLIEHYNDAATSSSITHTETSKTTASGLVDAEKNMASTTSVSAMTESTEVQGGIPKKKGKKFDGFNVLGKREEDTEKDNKHDQMPTTEVAGSSRMIHPASLKHRGSKAMPAHKERAANWAGMAAGKPRSPPDKPLLHAFRQAYKLDSDMFHLGGLATHDYESRLLPDDSGFMSMKREVSSRRRPPAAGKRGALIPIGKPKKVLATAGNLTRQHTSHLPQSSSQHSQCHLDPAQQDVTSQTHVDMTLKDSRNTDDHYDGTSRQSHTDHHYDDEHPSDAKRNFDLTKQQRSSRDPTSHYNLTKLHPRPSSHLYDPSEQHLHESTHHYDLTQHPCDPTHHYDFNKQHPSDPTHHYDISKQHPRDPTHHYDLNKQHARDLTHYYDLTKLHHQDGSRQYDLTNQSPHHHQLHYNSDSQPTPWSYTDCQFYVQFLQRLSREDQDDFTPQHRYHTERHYDTPSRQSPSSTVQPIDINSQHSHESRQKGNPILLQLNKDTLPSGTNPNGLPSTGAGTWNREQYPRGPLRPPGNVGQEYPQRTTGTKHGPTLPPPYNELPATDQQGKGREQGDVHWRESLHKLISLHGFRSHKAAKAVASMNAQPPQAQGQTRVKTILPPLRYSRHVGAPGDRVLRDVQLLTEGGGTSPLRFQNEIPVPWRLSHVPLKPQGQVRYGKLKMDWVRSEPGKKSEAERLTLPKMDLKQRSLFQG